MMPVKLKHASLALFFILAAGCALPFQSALVDQPVVNAPATVALSDSLPVTATLPPATALPSVPAPATLEAALIVSLWDEATGTTSLVPVDPSTGGALADYAPIALGQGFSSARSPDGRWLATVNYDDRACDAWAGGSRCQPSDGMVHFIELSAWRDVPTSVPASTNASFIVFSPDSRTLAIGQSAWPDHGLLLVDVASGALIAQAALDFYPDQATFSPDGHSLFIYGQHYTESNGFNPQARVAALAADSLALRWQQALPGILDGQYVAPDATNVHDESVWWTPAVAFAPEAQRLYVVHADTDTLTTVDFAAQTVTDLPIGPAQTWLDRLMALTAGVAEAKMVNGTEKHAVFAGGPEGQRLYVAGAQVDTRSGQYTRTPLGLQVIDPATGIELQTLDSPASFLSLAPGGRHLFLTAWDTSNRTQVIALDDLSTVAELIRSDVQLTRLVNGQPAVLALRASPQATAVRWLDPQTFAAIAEWSAPPSLWLLP